MQYIKMYMCLCLFVFASFCYAQEATKSVDSNRSSKNSIYMLGYGGLLTVGYERLLMDRLGITVSAASIALLHKDLRTGFAFPVHLSYYPIGTVHRIFLDLGCNFITKGKSNPIFDFYDGVNIPLIVGAGYNYHPMDGGLFAKIGGGLFIYSPNNSDDIVKSGFMWAVALGKSF